MRKRRNIKQLFIATLLLAVYVNVSATHLACGLAHFVDSLGIEHTHYLGHDHHHDGPVPENSHTHNDNHHHAPGNDDCCDDNSLAFFSLPTLIEKAEFKSISSPVVAIIPSFNLTNHPILLKEERIVFDCYLPPKIPDIRVFVQSFII